MKRVLIAGCGYLGTATARLFQDAGWTVEGWSRRGKSEFEPERQDQVRAMDLGDADQVSRAAGIFDVVIHAASTRGGKAEDYRKIYLAGARHLSDRFADAHLVFVSSTSVYAQREGEWVTEESAAQPEHETGRILREAENLVLEKGGTVLRLAGLYGPGRSALLQRTLRGEAVIDPRQDRFVNQLHRDDGAAALFLLSGLPDANGGQIYNGADDQPLQLSECYRWLAQRLGRPMPRMTETEATRKRGNSSKRVSNIKLRRAGWAPKFPSFTDGMDKSVLPDLNTDAT